MNKQKNKGITLIALVITIVILVILVGVSVSVAINTGLIENSKTAVANYDKAQKDEEKIMLDTLFTIQSAQKNVDLDMREGILMIAPKETSYTVVELSDLLPDGYSIGDKDGKAISDVDATIYTGVTIIKDSTIVGRVALLGDIDEDGEITTFDALEISNLMFGTTDVSDYKDYQKAAMDVDRNGEINEEDATFIYDYEADSETVFLDWGYRGKIADIVY